LHPKLVDDVREWFRKIKTFDGKAENKFGYEEKVLGAEKTLEIIEENRNYYKELIAGKLPNESGFWLGNRK
jgi:inorganic pyrophosphatase